jgi:hypothetical protein
MDELLTLSTVFGLKAIDLAGSDRPKPKTKDPRVKDRETAIVHDLSVVLNLLLPQADIPTLEGTLKGVVKQAVQLKNELAAERTLSTFFWYDTETDVDIEQVETRHPTHKDLFCVFPGIKGERLILDAPATVVMVKATAVAAGT